MKGEQTKASQVPLEEVPQVSLDLLKDFSIPTLEQWKELATGDLKGGDFDKKLCWKTLEGFTVNPIYTSENLKGASHLGSLPGFAPFVRGTSPLSGVSPRWQIRQDCLLPAPEDVNASVRDAIARGADAVSIRLDNAARQGFDGDSVEARDLAGRGGCTISSLNGLRLALADIDLAKYPITIRTGGAALPVLGMLVALADERGVDRRMLVGSVECDPHRKFLRRGSMQATLELHYREMTDMAAFCQEECPGIRPIIVNSHSWHNAGGSAVQELGYTLASAVEYIREMTKRGVTADKAFLSVLFSFSVSTNLFIEIAKLRAARLLWAKVATAFNVESEHAAKMFLHGRTSAFTKTLDDPYNNMVRTSLEAFAAAIGGCDSIYVAPFDEVVGPPDATSMRIARNQQIILQEEVALSRVVDPAGGSYYVESLTDSIAREAWAIFQRVEEEGGLVVSLRKGTPQDTVKKTAAKRRELLETRRESIVGVSNYANPTEKLLKKTRIPRTEFLRQRKERLERLKRMRRNSEVRRWLDLIGHAVVTGEGNLAGIAVEAAREGATIGEIMNAIIQESEGERITVEPLESWRASQTWEGLRARARAFAETKGIPPRIALVLSGPLAMKRARADFSRGFLAAAGFETIEIDAREDLSETVLAVDRSGALGVVACSDDPGYATLGPDLITALRSLSREIPVYIAGNPVESIDALNAAGVSGYIHMKCNTYRTLAEIQDKLGVNA
ncbi:MAG: acyl-CoA mutase large subunit family protein [Candidatus Sumerlaeia bacterium]|nr:acyl-CoA mutase large subunit family protein [Candidatus Sumerlaeia bacterium]